MYDLFQALVGIKVGRKNAETKRCFVSAFFSIYCEITSRIQIISRDSYLSSIPYEKRTKRSLNILKENCSIM
jgi:hypothetical protein